MDFELAKSAKIKARIYGVDIELERPTVGMIEAFEEQNEALKSDKDKLVLMKSFVTKLGVPASILKDMELEHYSRLIEFVMNPKKK
jgi:hypothetical protein